MKLEDIVVIAVVALVAGLAGGLVAGLVGDNQFGAGTRMPNGISADSTSPAVGEVRGTDLTITDDAAITDGLTVEGDTNLDNLVNGGASLATTTNGAGAFTAAQICDNNLIVATPNWQPVTLTGPSTAALVADCLPTIGDEKTIRLYNATTTTGSASIITLADGANGDHQEQEGATTLVEGTEWAEITFMNIDGTNHLMLVTVTQVAD